MTSEHPAVMASQWIGLMEDVQLGPAKLTADRLHFDGLDELEVVFDGFRPADVMVIVHRVTASNVSLQLAGKSS